MMIRNTPPGVGAEYFILYSEVRGLNANRCLSSQKEIECQAN